jgi:hypothetical protein
MCRDHVVLREITTGASHALQVGKIAFAIRWDWLLAPESFSLQLSLLQFSLLQFSRLFRKTRGLCLTFGKA